MVILNPVLNCSKNLLSSLVERVTTGTYNFVSVILNVAFVGVFITGLAGLFPWAALAVCIIISVKTQFSDQVKIKYTSKLMKGMSKVLQKLLQCFNGTIVSIFF